MLKKVFNKFKESAYKSKVKVETLKISFNVIGDPLKLYSKT